MSTTTDERRQEAPGTVLEPWTPPTPPSARRSPFTRAWITMSPAAFPAAIGLISWQLSDHGGGHSAGDATAGTLITTLCFIGGTVLSANAAKRQPATPTGIGESEPHTALLASRGSMAAFALAGLTALATIDTYTTAPWLRVLATVIAGAAPILYRRLITRHHDDLHLALTQRLALERTTASAQIKVEELRQGGKTHRTVVTEEQETARTRLTEDGKTNRTLMREQGATARALIQAYGQVATAPGTPAGGTAAEPVTTGLSAELAGLLTLSGDAARALSGEALALLGHTAAPPAPADPASSPTA